MLSQQSRALAVSLGFARRSSMRNVVSTATAIVVFSAAVLLSAAQFRSTRTSNGPRTPNGKADLNGVWQTFSTAHSDLGLRMH
jgi:hypothetical protein